ncbi:hypothetical protein BROC_00256 [Candidatus Brocadiaceae bacterium]|nr:hypothetical protein BROC_00256 [Candidatus Brocadiaceae bacterium]
MSLVTIDQKLNSHFNPIDLFIRLNNKPFPIKENSFEMWNSYIDKEIIEEIKKNVEKYGSWFYLRQNGIRMENEELYTSLAYLEYKHPVSVSDENDPLKHLDFYHKSTGIIARIKSKNDITKVLATASTKPEVRSDFLKSIKVTESFIKKLRIILIDQDLEDETAYLCDELDNIIDVKDERYFRRKLQDFYLLWFILHGLNQELVIAKRTDLKKGSS